MRLVLPLILVYNTKPNRGFASLPKESNFPKKKKKKKKKRVKDTPSISYKQYVEMIRPNHTLSSLKPKTAYKHDSYPSWISWSKNYCSYFHLSQNLRKFFLNEL